MEDILGFRQTNEEGNMLLFTTDAPIGRAVIVEVTEQQAGKNGRGIVHHVAFRAADKDMLRQRRLEVLRKGLHATNVIDRHWFKSVYFRTPAGVLFEMASDGPGYAVDEDPNHLGEQLILPPWMEEQREQIENQLPEFNY